MEELVGERYFDFGYDCIFFRYYLFGIIGFNDNRKCRLYVILVLFSVFFVGLVILSVSYWIGFGNYLGFRFFRIFSF